jgi:xylose isomerase
VIGMSDYFIGSKEYFPRYRERSVLRARGSDNPLAFKFYDPDAMVGGKTMRRALCGSPSPTGTAFCGDGGDPFGNATMEYPWAGDPDPMDGAPGRSSTRLSSSSPRSALRSTAFHDMRTWPRPAPARRRFEKNLVEMTDLARERQESHRSEASLGHGQRVQPIRAT